MQNADKRQVATDALETLGTILVDPAGRDAIHLAVEPAVAGGRLRPGEHVGRLADGRYGKADQTLGVVDPFLPDLVEPGQRFWLVVYPRQITSLRHVWAHPAFPAQPGIEATGVSTEQKQESEEWLRRYAADHDVPDYEALVAAAAGEERHRYSDDNDDDEVYFIRNYGDCIGVSGRDASGEIPPEYWQHMERVIGRPIPDDKRAKYFTCSC